MKSTWKLIISFGLFGTLLLAGPDPALTPATFKQIYQACQADGSASWRSVPWEISLLDAQKKAATVRKPLFIWAMDGHPLGCT